MDTNIGAKERVTQNRLIEPHGINDIRFSVVH